MVELEAYLFVVGHAVNFQKFDNGINEAYINFHVEFLHEHFEIFELLDGSSGVFVHSLYDAQFGERSFTSCAPYQQRNTARRNYVS